MTDISICNSCRICGNPDLITLFDLGEQCLGSIFPKIDENSPPRAPVVLVKCNDSHTSNYPNACGLVQLKHTVNACELYTDNYGYRSGLNNTMINHLRDLVNDILDHCPNLHDNDVVVDIGSNDATLLRQYTNIKPELNLIKIGIDPCGTQFSDYYPNDVQLIPTFFSKSAMPVNTKAKIVSSISMFYDLPDPVAFARHVHDVLDEDGLWVMEQSYLPTMLQQNSFDTICHEHLEYYSLKQIKWICDHVGFTIVDVSMNFINGGSFRVYLKKGVSTSNALTTTRIIQAFSYEQDWKLDDINTYNVTFDIIAYQKRTFMAFVQSEREKNKTFALYGASTKGNTLLQYYGLDNTIVYAAAERNERKFGRKTPGSEIPIFSEEDVRGTNPDYMIVLPWHFKKEFLEREKPYLQSGGKLIFPLPYFEVV